MPNNFIKLGNALKGGLFSSLLSTIINLGLYFYGVSKNAFGENIAVSQTTGTPITEIEVGMVSFIAPIIAAILYWLISKIFERNKLVFSILSVLVFAAFAPLPLQFLNNSTDLTIIILEVMHTVVFVFTLLFQFTIGSKY